MEVRDYDVERDHAAVHRMWVEIGWIDKGEEEKLDRFWELARRWSGRRAGK